MQITRSTVMVATAVVGAGLLLASCSRGLFSLKQVSTETKATTTARAGEGTQKAKLHEAYGKLPLSFIKNEGQVDQRVEFYEKGSRHTTFFTKDGVYLTLTRSSDRPHQRGVSAPPSASDHVEVTSDVVKLRFLKANPEPRIIAEGVQEGKVNYFIGSDPNKWRTNVPIYQSVVYKEIYPGIDIKFYGTNRQMEYDIVVRPGADPSRVRLAYEGIEKLDLTETGDLEVVLKEGTIIQKKPIVYQEIESIGSAWS